MLNRQNLGIAGTGKASSLSLAWERNTSCGTRSSVTMWSNLTSDGPAFALSTMLMRWCKASLLFLAFLEDQMDSLVSDTLVSLMRQLRNGNHHWRQSLQHQDGAISPQWLLWAGCNFIECNLKWEYESMKSVIKRSPRQIHDYIDRATPPRACWLYPSPLSQIPGKSRFFVKKMQKTTSL